MEVVGELEDLPEDPIEFYKRIGWVGVAQETWFYKYRAPQNISRTENYVRKRKQKMLDPKFATELHGDIEEKQQNIDSWRFQLK